MVFSICKVKFVAESPFFPSHISFPTTTKSAAKKYFKTVNAIRPGIPLVVEFALHTKLLRKKAHQLSLARARINGQSMSAIKIRTPWRVFWAPSRNFLPYRT